MTRKYTSLPYTEYVVADGHYDTSRAPITKIVLHSTATDKQGVINTFGGGTRMVSAHYAIDNDGNLMAFLEEFNTAYHCGNYATNQSTIGIEHVDEGADKRIHTDKQYDMSIKLVADICRFYNIPCDTTHVIPHSSVVATACPNGLDVNRIVSGAYKLLNPNVDLQKENTQLKADITRLNGIIAQKDIQIKGLQDSIKQQQEVNTALQNSIPSLLAKEKNNCQNSIKEFLIKKVGILLEEWKK